MESNPITKVHRERIALLDKKGHDYTANINGVHVDNLKIAGLPGIAIRILDKATRAVALTLGGKEPKVIKESLRDTLIDAGNYSDLGVLFIDGTYEEFRPSSGGDTRVRSKTSETVSAGVNIQTAIDPETEEEEEVAPITCFHSRNMFRTLEEGINRHSPKLWEEAISYNTGDISFNGANTPNQVIQMLSHIVTRAKHVHVVWDGTDLFIPMIVGMAFACGIPVTVGKVDFPQGHPSRMHAFINSLPALEA